tara:strand:+ start:137 stop:343 length:207 start_codon:yes stop_codon:yes gene_type:complete
MSSADQLDVDFGGSGPDKAGAVLLGSAVRTVVNRLENLTALCPSCHAKKEAELRRVLPLFGSASTGDK